MKKSLCLSFLAVMPLLLAACVAPSSSDSFSSVGGGSSTSTSGGSSMGQSSDATSSLDSSTSQATPLSEGWAGLVKLYYRNDAGDYGDKALWIWAAGVDGFQTSFDNDGDDYGVYHIIDLSSAPFKGTAIAGFSFIIKPKVGWSGQSTDTVVTLNDFSSTLATSLDGKEMITVYGSDAGNGTIDTYARQSDAEGDRLLSVEMTSWTGLKVTGTGKSDGRADADVGKVSSYKLYGFSPDYYLLSDVRQITKKEEYLLLSGEPGSNSFEIRLPKEALPSTAYEIEAIFASDLHKTKTKFASFVPLYDTPDFVSKYTYSGSDLGLSFTSDNHEIYKLWAPTASRVQVRRYYFGTPAALAIDGKAHPTYDAHGAADLTLGDNGVWSFRDPQSRYFRFYAFAVTSQGATNEVADPYAISSGVNGVRSAILSSDDIAKVSPAGFGESLAALTSQHPLLGPNALSVYEVHVRDFTADSSWISNKGNPNGTYEAFCEEGTSYEGVTTGFDHLKELGVNAVQLMPVFDQDNDERTLPIVANGETTYKKPGYNWGYNPLNFNVVEGSYSSDPFSPTARITEFKDLVKACADSGIRVIMDVVYNHVSSVAASCFSKIMPKYYFRTMANGGYSAGSGCGNDFASERAMARNYIVGSVKWWAKEYGIKGFRFDLMGSLDLTTMKAVKAALYDIDKQIVVYGEPWIAGETTLAASERAITSNVYSKLFDCGHGDTIGCFNDDCYGGIVGNTNGSLPGYGFISQGPGYLSSDTMYKAANSMIGVNDGDGANPYQTVNYVACHDNYTLYDHMNYCLGSGVTSAKDSKDAMSATIASQAAVLYSEGIAFINGGDEILRQKIMFPGDPSWASLQQGDYVDLADGTRLIRNSYASGDAVNSFKWSRKADPAVNETYQKIRQAVALRRQFMGDSLGLSYADISTNQKATVWSGLVPSVPVIAIYTRGLVTSSDYYALLGGRMDSDWSGIGIGNGSLEVVYSSNDSLHSAGQRIDVTNYSLGAGKFEFLVVKRIS